MDFHELRGGAVPGSHDPKKFLKLSRWMTLAWGAVLAVLGTFQWGPLLVAGLTVASITFGSLLGLFVLAFLLKRATPVAALTGMFVGLAAMAYIYIGTQLLWTWYVLAGTGITFLAGLLASYATGPSTAIENAIEKGR
jgi:Na+/proline symporter